MLRSKIGCEIIMLQFLNIIGAFHTPIFDIAASNDARNTEILNHSTMLHFVHPPLISRHPIELSRVPLANRYGQAVPDPNHV